MPEVCQQTRGDRAVGPRAVDFQGAAVQQMQVAVQIEFVALGVAAEIVVVVENQDAAVRPSVCAR